MKKFTILLLLCFFLTACVAPEATIPDKSRFSGIFRDYITASFGTLNMYTTSDSVPFTIAKRCTARLYTMLIDGDGYRYTGDLAESEPVPLDDGGTSWEIALRRGYRWANGEEITADDFIYSMQQLLDPAAKNSQASVISSGAYASIAGAAEYFAGKTPWENVGIKKTDDTHILLTTAKKVTADLIMRTFELSYTMLVYEPLYESSRGADGTSAYATSLETFMSAGPFILTEWTPDAKWEFRTNPDYIYADLYSIEGMTVSVVPDASTAIELFLNGKLDYLALSNNQWEQFEDDPRVYEYWNNSLQYMFINLGNPSQNGLLGNINFRRALYFGADRTSLSAALGAIPATRIVRKSVVGDPRTGTAFVDMPCSSDYVDDGYTVYKPALANEYLTKALEKCSLSAASMEIYYGETATHAKAASEIMQSQYAQVFNGRLSVPLRSVPASIQFNLRRWNPDDPTAFEANIGSVTPSAAAPYYTFQYYTSTYSPPRFCYSNPDYDACYARAAAAEDPLEMAELCRTLEKMLLDDLVVVPLYEIPNKAMFSERIKLPVSHALNNFGFGYEFCTISE